MRFTAEDIRRQLESSALGTQFAQQTDIGMQNLFSSMALAAQNTLLEGCPVFIERLRADPDGSNIKNIMQNWGREEPSDSK
jgi:hypothetical protein